MEMWIHMLSDDSKRSVLSVNLHYMMLIASYIQFLGIFDLGNGFGLSLTALIQVN